MTRYYDFYVHAVSDSMSDNHIFVDYVEPNKKVNEKRSLAIAETACVTLRSVTAADRLTLNMTM